MSEPKNGDRVRVAYEGTFDQVMPYSRQAGARVVKDSTGYRHFYTAEDVDIEVIEPEYEVGKVYKRQGGGHYIRQINGWRGFLTGQLYTDEQVPGQFTKLKLVPDEG